MLREEIMDIESKKGLPKNHHLYKLSPYVSREDGVKILRAGGRLALAQNLKECSILLQILLHTRLQTRHS